MIGVPLITASAVPNPNPSLDAILSCMSAILYKKLSSLSSIKIRHRNFVRSIVRCAVHVKYDSQGRIPVPDSLLKYAKIDKNVIVIGMIKKIEIWSPSLLNKDQKDNLLDDDYEDLPNEINF